MLLKNIEQFNNLPIRKGCWIIIAKALSIPPHFFLIIDDCCYGLSTHGVQLGEAVKPFLELVRRKQQPTLFLEWKLEDATYATHFIRESLSHYRRVEVGGPSCLAPLLDLAADVNGAEMKKARFFFELFPLLQSRNQIGRIMQLNMDGALNGMTFQLPVYTQLEIDTAIEAIGV